MLAALVLLALALAPTPPITEASISLDDLRWFPPAAVAEANVRMAEAHIRWLRWQQAWDVRNHVGWQLRINEAEELRKVWLLLAGAHGIWHDEEDWPCYGCSLWQMENLRDRLGREDYFAGRMPLPVPLWRFRRQ